MDTRDGMIYSAEQVSMMPESKRQYMRPMEIPPTPVQAKDRKVGRNDPCPCGSGHKFKRCCLLTKVGAR
jgi:uncharacterized protein YecA (UPF0149 family)